MLGPVLAALYRLGKIEVKDMTHLTEAWVQTTNDVYHFDDRGIQAGKFAAFLLENSKDVVSIQTTTNMTVAEFNAIHPELAR